MRLRHILEYEDHEIKDLLGDLETVGQASKRTYSLWVSLPSFMFNTGYPTGLKLLLALGDPFWSRGSLRADEPLILDSLRKGDFTRPSLPEQDWILLGGREVPEKDPDETESQAERRRSREVVHFLDVHNLRDYFVSSRLPLIQTLDSLREEMMNIFHPGSVHTGGVALVYGEAEDPDLLIQPNASLYHASVNKEGVVLEDLTNPDKHRTYRRDLIP